MLTCFLNIYFQRMYVCVYAFLFMYRTNLNAADFVCVLLIYFLLQKFKFFYLLFAHISFAFVFAVIFVFRNTYHDTFFAFIVKAGTQNFQCIFTSYSRDKFLIQSIKFFCFFLFLRYFTFRKRISGFRLPACCLLCQLLQFWDLEQFCNASFFQHDFVVLSTIIISKFYCRDLICFILFSKGFFCA